MSSWLPDEELSASAAANSRVAPRWHIDVEALEVLEGIFRNERFPNVEMRKKLGADLRVSPRQIQVWFQNRRQRERKHSERGKRSGDVDVSDDGEREESLNTSTATVRIPSGDLAEPPGQQGGQLAVLTNAHVASESLRKGIPLAPLPPDTDVAFEAPLLAADSEVPNEDAPSQTSETSEQAHVFPEVPVLTETPRLHSEIPTACIYVSTDGEKPSEEILEKKPALVDATSFPQLSRKRELAVQCGAEYGRTIGGKTSCTKLAGSPTSRNGCPENEYSWHATMCSLLPRLLATTPQPGIAGCALNGMDPMQPLPQGRDASKLIGMPVLLGRADSAGLSTGPESVASSVVSRLAEACQSTLLGKTLHQFGGIVQAASHPCIFKPMLKP